MLYSCYELFHQASAGCGAVWLLFEMFIGAIKENLSDGS